MLKELGVKGGVIRGDDSETLIGDVIKEINKVSAPFHWARRPDD